MNLGNPGWGYGGQQGSLLVTNRSATEAKRHARSDVPYSEAVLSELGFSDQEIAQWRQTGMI